MSDKQRREILAVGLLAAAVFVLLSLLPVGLLGSKGPEWFPSGNIMGVAGNWLRAPLVTVFGAAAPLLAAMLGVGALSAADRSGGRGWHWAALTGGLLLLVPTLIWVALPGVEPAAGWVGATVGGPLHGLVGRFGAVFVTSVLLVVLAVATLEWSAVNALGRLGTAAARGTGQVGQTLGRGGLGLAGGLARRARSLWQRAGERSAQRAADEADAPPVEGMEPEWLERADPDMDGSAAAGEPEDEGEDAHDEIEPEAVEEGTSDLVGDGEVEGEDEEPEDDEDDLAEPTGLDEDSEARHVVPPVDLLSGPEAPDRDDMERTLDELGTVLVDKLRTFNVESSIGGRTTGPVVTQFEVVPAPGVKVNRIANLDADLALAMKAKTIRIVAPIPGKGAVGVEIPNPKSEIVNLREILESSAFKRAKGELPLALGKDLTGKPYVSALEKMPHVLIAGATGAGKSVCLNTIVTSLVYRHTAETLRLLMIDPKMVELSVYSRLPHLRHNVVTDPRDAAGVLKWAVLEMERRYTLLKANYVRSIQEFNNKVRAGQPLQRSEPVGREGDEDRWVYTDGIMPYIVVVVDELADLMMTVQSEVEKPLTQLAQKARAIGIHLIVATQRPSVNVITGLIKANFPTRIAFRVASKTDSRTILDQNGADALLGNGDMLFLPPGGSEPVRIQGAYLPTEDTERLMTWYADLTSRHMEEEGTLDGDESDILEELRSQELDDAAAAVDEIAGDWDELFRAAAEVCIQNGGGSTSLLQRRLSIGYGRAARIVDQLFDTGVLGPSDGSKGREVLVTMDELDSICGPG
jgi:S-DNA-T family DNA segregation ATPase FtsK/SpoIIIE